MGWYLMAYQHPLCRSGGLAVRTADLVRDGGSSCAIAALQHDGVGLDRRLVDAGSTLVASLKSSTGKGRMKCRTCCLFLASTSTLA